MHHPAAANDLHHASYLIIVMGVSGSGKSSLAKALADHYGYAYLDADDFHSSEARDHMANGQPLTDAMRLPWVIRMRDHFRKECNHLHSTLAFSGLRRMHRNELRGTGFRTIFLFLQGDRDTIQSRVNKRAGHFMAPSLLDSQFESLEDPSLEQDVHTIDVHTSFERVLAMAIQVVDRELHRHSNALLA